jgi:hypothetical protein
MASGSDIAQRMRDSDLETLAAFVANSQPGSQASEAAKAELTRREILLHGETARAQQNAAKYTLWTAIVAAIAAVVSIFALLYQIFGR